MKYLGMEEMNIDKELKELIADDKRIPAIKRVREETGMGLKETKEYVDIEKLVCLKYNYDKLVKMDVSIDNIRIE
jgi:ribosomal protein L7/L12